MSRALERSLIGEHLADPFVFEHAGAYYVVGSRETTTSGTTGGGEASVFSLHSSRDLEHFTPEGSALVRPRADLGDTFWAPEIAHANGIFYLYYSVGFDDRRHQLRVATSRRVTGPYRDAGILLTSGGSQRFASHPHPFQDRDGRFYLFYACELPAERDATGANVRPGTAIVVQELESMLRLGPRRTIVLRPRFDWQRLATDRPLHGGRFDWHVLESPEVVYRDGTYHCFYSGGRVDGASSGVDYAIASHVLGPYDDSGAERGPRVLASVPGACCPGVSSLLRRVNDSGLIAHHAWDPDRCVRRLHLRALEWTFAGPRVRGHGPVQSPRQKAELSQLSRV